MRTALPLLVTLALAGIARADAATTLHVEPGSLTLVGRDSGRQLLVTLDNAAGKLRDVTGQVQYAATPAGIVSIDASGYATAIKEGTATVTVQLGQMTTTTTIKVERIENDAPVDFANQVVPIFTRFGCNVGGCHGKADGQNGFKLSLFGFEPGDDYEFLVREGRGRRIYGAAPDHSLLLRKASGDLPHGGGKRLAADSPYYRILRRWIEQGALNRSVPGAAVARIEVLPRERTLERGAAQQLVVLAHHADGSVTDVTRLAQFDANQPELGGVSPTGLVTVKEVPGSVAIMVRYQAHVGVFRATVPLGATMPDLPASDHWIDKLVTARWRALGLPPSDLCDDGTFLRRATLDIAGRLPTLEETQAFLASKEGSKRAALVDRLLASPDYADYFALKWGNILRNRRRGIADDPKPTIAFHTWIRQSLASNKPYDRFVREILTASGEEIATPPVVWYRELKEPTALMEDAAQLFLGQRVGCARCHHHPFEKWSQADYWSFAAFWNGVDVKEARPAKKNKAGELEAAEPARVLLKEKPVALKHPRTGQPLAPLPLGGDAPMSLAAGEDPRVRLADWMTHPANPFFARALVNRYWKHFLGRGLIDPEDDLRLTNPASNPELLDALATSFIESKYDLKQLVRAICTSRAYQLSALPNAHNAADRQNYSRFLPRRLHAEVLLDALDDVTGGRTRFRSAPANMRAVQLPDNLSESYFLSVFGKPDAASACECERNGDGSLAQALHMFNSMELLGKLAGPRAQALANDTRPVEDRLSELYLRALCRPPTNAELSALTTYLTKKGGTQAAYEDVLWALLNTKEFQFNH
jgi:hypothetical protein